MHTSDGRSGASVRVVRARRFFARLRGLIGKPLPQPGVALWISPCRQVHTFWMRGPIDVLHLDAGGRVLAVQTLRPWRFGRWVLGAAGVLEMRGGEALRLGLTVGSLPRLIDDESRVTRG